MAAAVQDSSKNSNMNLPFFLKISVFYGLLKHALQVEVGPDGNSFHQKAASDKSLDWCTLRKNAGRNGRVRAVNLEKEIWNLYEAFNPDQARLWKNDPVGNWQKETGGQKSQ